MLACYKCDYMLPDQDGEAYCQCGAKMFQSEPWAVEPQKRLQMIADGIGYEVWAAYCNRSWDLFERKPNKHDNGIVLTWWSAGIIMQLNWDYECPDDSQSLLYAEPGGQQ